MHDLQAPGPFQHLCSAGLDTSKTQGLYVARLAAVVVTVGGLPRTAAPGRIPQVAFPPMLIAPGRFICDPILPTELSGSRLSPAPKLPTPRRAHRLPRAVFLACVLAIRERDWFSLPRAHATSSAPRRRRASRCGSRPSC
jgi:hypothetical protein